MLYQLSYFRNLSTNNRKVMLYQLSYFRNLSTNNRNSFPIASAKVVLFLKIPNTYDTFLTNKNAKSNKLCFRKLFNTSCRGSLRT